MIKSVIKHFVQCTNKKLVDMTFNFENNKFYLLCLESVAVKIFDWTLSIKVNWVVSQGITSVKAVQFLKIWLEKVFDKTKYFGVKKFCGNFKKESEKNNPYLVAFIFNAYDYLLGNNIITED